MGSFQPVGCWCSTAGRTPGDDDRGGVRACGDVAEDGWTIFQIAEEVGEHPATVSKWLAEGPPPVRRAAVTGPVIDDRWARIDGLLEQNRDLLAT